MAKITLETQFDKISAPDDLIELPNGHWRRFGHLQKAPLMVLVWWVEEQHLISQALANFYIGLDAALGPNEKVSSGWTDQQAAELLRGTLADAFGTNDKEEIDSLVVLAQKVSNDVILPALD